MPLGYKLKDSAMNEPGDASLVSVADRYSVESQDVLDRKWIDVNIPCKAIMSPHIKSTASTTCCLTRWAAYAIGPVSLPAATGGKD